MNKIKGDKMAAAAMAIESTKNELPQLPIPDDHKILRQAEISMALWKLVAPEMKRKKHKVRNIIEYGFEAYLLKCNPESYAKWEEIKKSMC